MPSDSLGEVGDITAPEGSRPWAIAVRLLMTVTLHDTEATVQKFRDLMLAYSKSNGYMAITNQFGKAFQTLEDFCEAPHPYGLDLPPFVLKHIQGAKSETKRLRVAFEEVGYKPPTAQEMAETAIANRDDGKGMPETGEFGAKHKIKVDNINLNQGGTSAQYLVDRLARDAKNKKRRLTPEVQSHRASVLDRMKAGEFRSVRAAAIEAGIVKPDTPLKVLMRAWNRASIDERAKFLLWTTDAPTSALDTAGGT